MVALHSSILSDVGADNKKTLELASSAEEKRDVNPTSALGPLVLPRQRGAWLPRSVAVGEADEALDSGPPFVGLVRRRRIVQEQLGPRQGFCWSGGRRR